MGYLEIALMVEDSGLDRRITACAALEGIPAPRLFATQRKWEIVARTDWEAAWTYAATAAIPDPGVNTGVITDAMILASVQEVRNN